MDSIPFSFVSLANIHLINELHDAYLKDPESVDLSWRYFFAGWEFAQEVGAPEGKAESPDVMIDHLIDAYRTYGHLAAFYNPLDDQPRKVEQLQLDTLGFSKGDLDKTFPTNGFLKEGFASLQDIVDALVKTYCRTIGVEYKEIDAPEIEAWLQERIEPFFELKLSKEEKLRILQSLLQAELFEAFIHTNYVGQKRFSLEGGETLIPMLSTLVETGSKVGVKEVVIGMAHRGRLNVLANILNKSYGMIFHEFEDHYSPDMYEGTGDVKYHKGFVGKYNDVAITLAANPSHLESVDPVVEGIVRSKQDMGAKENEVVPVLIHGDAALSGQGVVYETLQLRTLEGYKTGGTIHVIVNNQIGFTTLPEEGRSTHYCTDIAKTFSAPVFHVNAEDPEGCAYAMQLAMHLRQNFHCDVFIDLYCYRKYGHNEGDEPRFTQPLQYKQIDSKEPIRAIYRKRLIAEGVLTEEEAAQSESEFKNSLNEALEHAKKPTEKVMPPPQMHPPVTEAITTAVPCELLHSLTELLTKPPEGFTLNRKIDRLLKEKRAMLETSKGLDWGTGEWLCFATLLKEGYDIRISGQDSQRGTFTHRQAVWTDQENGSVYSPFSQIDEGNFRIYNSPLSEFAVLGFEYGYSLYPPRCLPIWEAQFGDFSNGAQVIIDQYIVSSEQKWNLFSNLTLLLPHGYEGQGPEHSSARIERFLQMCGHDNMRIVNPSTPAQLFHLLRMQARHPIKRPLIVFTPKMLLRLPACRSPLDHFCHGTFEPYLDDPTPPSSPKRVLLCSGKVYYDLIAHREKTKANVAIIRIEQLYPIDKERLQALLSRYATIEDWAWVQEEHENMGAWNHIKPYLDKKVRYIGRTPSASPASGSYTGHQKELKQFLEEAFAE